GGSFAAMHAIDGTAARASSAAAITKLFMDVSVKGSSMPAPAGSARRIATRIPPAARGGGSRIEGNSGQTPGGEPATGLRPPAATNGQAPCTPEGPGARQGGGGVPTPPPAFEADGRGRGLPLVRSPRGRYPPHPREGGSVLTYRTKPGRPRGTGE